MARTEYDVRMPNIVVYAGPDTESLWKRAREKAEAQDMSLSKYVTRLVRNDASLGLNQGKEMTPTEKFAEAQRLMAEAMDELLTPAALDEAFARSQRP